MGPTDRGRSGGRVTIIDDDEIFRESLSRNLTNAGLTPVAFSDGPSALEQISTMGKADLILLDWMMPGMNGLDVLRELRRRSVRSPVVLLTVLSDQIHEEASLHGGAVDFIEKSRSFSIILQRIELILNGSKAASAPKTGQQPPPVFMHGQLLLRHDVNRAIWRDAQVDLSLTEFQIVTHLVGRAGQDVKYRDIYDLVHGQRFIAGSGEFGFRANVRALIKRIRQKFRDVDPAFDQIDNYPGFGYRWTVPEAVRHGSDYECFVESHDMGP